MIGANNTWDDALRTLTSTLLKRKCDESVQRKWLRDTVATSAAGPPPTIPWDHLDPYHCAAAFERSPPRTAESYMDHLTETWCTLVAAAIADEEEKEEDEEEKQDDDDDAGHKEKDDYGTQRRRRLIVWLLCRVDPPRMGRLLARANFVGLLVQMTERHAADADWIVAEVAAHAARIHAARGSSGSSSANTLWQQQQQQQQHKTPVTAGGEWTTITITRRTTADGMSTTTLRCPCCRGRMRRGEVEQFVRALIVASAHPRQHRKWSLGGAALMRVAQRTWSAQVTTELATLSTLLWSAAAHPWQQIPPQQTPPSAWPIRRRAVWCGVCE